MIRILKRCRASIASLLVKGSNAHLLQNNVCIHLEKLAVLSTVGSISFQHFYCQADRITISLLFPSRPVFVPCRRDCQLYNYGHCISRLILLDRGGGLPVFRDVIEFFCQMAVDHLFIYAWVEHDGTSS